jgi:ubiquinone/menaquinone biosynthesis C-methylase UbiE
MKTRESGMPNEGMWGAFFNPDSILDRLNIANVVGNITDLACGYGTFTIPVARRTKGKVFAIDIEPEMIEATQRKTVESGLQNIEVIQKDFVTGGTSLANSSCEHVLLFNILHAENPLKILAEAKRILLQGGKIDVIHWNYDPTTPRGPSMDIRPRPEQIQKWLIEAGFKLEGELINLPPYHYGLIGQKLS